MIPRPIEDMQPGQAGVISFRPFLVGCLWKWLKCWGVGGLLERGANPDAPFRTCGSIEATPLGFVLTQFRPEVGSPASASASVPVSGSRLGWSSWSPPGPDTPLPEQVWEMFRPHVNLGLENNQGAVAWWISEADGRPLTPVARGTQAAMLGARLGLKLPAVPPGRWRGSSELWGLPVDPRHQWRFPGPPGLASPVLGPG